MEQLVTTTQEVLLNIFSFLPTNDLNNAALVSTHCEYIARCAYIQTRISQHFYKNPHCGGSKLPTAQAYFSYFVRRVIIPIQHQVNTLVNNKRGSRKTILNGVALPPLQLLIELNLECEILFDSLCSVKDADLIEFPPTLGTAVSFHDRKKIPIEALAARSHMSEVHHRIYDVLVDKHKCKVTSEALGLACEYQNMDFIERVLKYHPDARRIAVPPNAGYPIFSFAALLLSKPVPLDTPNRDEKIDRLCYCLELLVENGFDLNRPDYPFPYETAFALRSDKLIKRVIDLGLMIGINLISRIVRYSNLELYLYAKKVYEKGDTHQLDYEVFQTGLLWNYLTDACKYGNQQLIHYFIKDAGLTGTLWSLPVHVWAKPIADMPLAYAVEGKQYEVAKYIINLDPTQLSAQRVKGVSKTSMMKACEMGDLEMVKVLLSFGDPPVQRNVDQVSTVHLACSSLNVELVKLLLEKHKEVDLSPVTNSDSQLLEEVDSVGRTAFHHIFYRKQTNYYKLKEMLLFLFANTDPAVFTGHHGNEIIAAVHSTHLLPKSIKSLCELYFRCSPKRELQRVYEGDTEYVKSHLESWANDIIYDCLDLATGIGCLDMVQLLIRWNPDLASRLNLTLAIESGNASLVAYVIEVSGKFESVTTLITLICECFGTLPAIAMPLLDVVITEFVTNRFNTTVERFQLKIDCDYAVSQFIDAFSKSFSTPLHVAIYRHNIERIIELMRNNVDLKVKDRQGRSYIHCAMLSGDTEIIKMFGELFDEPANTLSCVLLAAQSGSLDAVKYVIENMGSECLTHKDETQQNILHILFQYPTSFEALEESLKYLIEHYPVSGLITQPDENGTTPLNLARFILPVDSPLLDYLIIESQHK